MAIPNTLPPSGLGRLIGRRNGAGKTAQSATRLSERLIDAAQGETADALELLQTNAAGLTEEEVERRREFYGPNEIARDKPPAWYIQLGEAFLNPFIGVLAVLIVASLFLNVILVDAADRDYHVIVVLSSMILISAFLRFFQEYRSSQAAEQLKAMVRTTATVIRHDTGKQEVSLSDLVPGDIIQLTAGDMIPADVRLLTSKDLYVSQAILTGEALPVEKYDTLGNVAVKSAAAEPQRFDNPLDIPRIALMGTSVSSGMATAAVVATGSDTYFGSMARSLVGVRAMTSFDRGINAVSWLLIRFMLVMVPVVFIINGVTKHDWLQALLFGLSVAVGLTPEMLPVMVTGNLARGALQMAKRKSIVKRLNSIQNFGAMDVLCTDKTGTLTQDRIILEQHLDVYGDDSDRVLEYAYLNAAYQTGLKNLLDVAVITYAREQQEEEGGPDIAYHKVDEVPFDFLRRRLSVIVEADADQHLLVCKGAVDEVLSVCNRVEDRGEVTPLTPAMRDRVIKLADDLSEDGLRVLAVAYREFPGVRNEYHLEDESQLVLLGCITFLDPPKETAGPAIAALRDHGVAVKILTGDSELVTRKVCSEVGLASGDVVLGNDLERLTEAELAEVAQRTTVFAKLSPMQKSRVVRALQRSGHTVGYLGDGINDAPALRDADVGISVDTGADIAKESADIILLEKSLLVLEEGVVLGRRTFGNIIKYIKMTASSNFGNMFSVLGSSVLLPFLPMLPIHLVVLDFTYHISQLSIPWDNLDDEYLKVPRRWNAGDIGRFMVCVGPISSIFDYSTFALLWFIYHATTPAHQSLFQSGWFMESLLTQTLIVHMIRTQKIPFIQSTASAPVLLLTTLAMAAGVVLPFSGLGRGIGMQALPLSFFPWLVLTLLSYCALTQVLKMVYIRRFKMWL